MKNLFLKTFWMLTISLASHFITMQFPWMFKLGFWSIVGGLILFSILPIILLFLSKKFDYKINQTTNKFYIFLKYVFFIISLILSLFLLLSSFGSLFDNHI